MIKAKQINKIIDYGTIIIGVYFIGTAIAGAIKRKREIAKEEENVNE